MVDLTQAHKASIEVLGTRHTALVEAVRNYVNGSVRPSIDELIAAVEDVTTDIDIKEKMLLGLVSRQAIKPVPSLILDFKTRHYLQGARRPEKGYGIHDLLTVKRATSKRVYNASGKLVEVPANEPAYQHDPVTGEPLGLLIEESRTNLVLWSEDLTSAAWNKYDEDLWEFSESTKPSPIGGVNFSRFFVPQDVVGETSLYSQSKDTVVDSDYVFSFIVSKDYNLLRYCQIDGMSGNRSMFDIDTGTFEYIQSSHTAEVTDLGDSWLVWVSFAAADVTARVGVMPQEVSNIGYSRDFTAGGYQYTTGFQFEEGSTPSSYVPTTDSPVTRAEDNVSRALGEEFNPSEGTLYAEFIAWGDGQFNGAVGIGHTADRATNSITVFYDGARNGVSGSVYGPGGGSGILRGEIGEVFPGELVKAALAYDVGSGSISLAVNGQSYGSTSAEFKDTGLFDQVVIGNLRTVADRFRLGAPVSSARCYPRALTEQELIDLTS